MSVTRVLGAAFLIALSSLGRTSEAADRCERLSMLSLADTAIASARTVPPGEFSPPDSSGSSAALFKNLPSFCRVEGSVKRPGDTDVKIEIWLPTEGWNGDFQPAASPFAGGTIGYGEMAQLLRAGGATASTNRGHEGAGPWKIADLSPLPYHLMVDRARALVAAYYGRRPTLTFMNECGGGGSRDALQETQNWPDDLDAAAAVGPVYYATHHGVAQMWVYQATHQNESAYVPPSKYGVIHQAALDACDARDGVKDAVIEDPDHCRFDPGVLLCRNGDAPNCLTAPQVEAVRTIYRRPVHARTGRPLYSRMVPGGELGWTAMAGPMPYPYAIPFFRNLVFKDPDWDYKTRPVNFDADVDRADAPGNLPINANNPDLQPFIARGGKLLLIGGWNDHTLGPSGPLDYYASVVAKLGKRVTRSVRLFMVPAMDHCLGESYPYSPTTTVDVVTVLKTWKASGRAPDQLIVSQSMNGQERRRLVCAYPRVAKYSGRGDTTDLSNYSCGKP